MGRLLLRLAVAAVFVGHGSRKLFGWFGGGGIAVTAEGFERMGLRPGRPNAIAAGVAEVGGGALLATGFATPVAASLLSGTMLTVIQRAHLQNGFWAEENGYENDLVLIAAVLALVEAGPGTPSVDSALGRERFGPGWALAAIAGGALGASAAHALAERHRGGLPVAV